MVMLFKLKKKTIFFFNAEKVASNGLSLSRHIVNIIVICIKYCQHNNKRSMILALSNWEPLFFNTDRKFFFLLSKLWLKNVSAWIKIRK